MQGLRFCLVFRVPSQRPYRGYYITIRVQGFWNGGWDLGLRAAFLGFGALGSRLQGLGLGFRDWNQEVQLVASHIDALKPQPLNPKTQMASRTQRPENKSRISCRASVHRCHLFGAQGVSQWRLRGLHARFHTPLHHKAPNRKV